MNLKLSSAKWQSFWGLNIFRLDICVMIRLVSKSMYPFHPILYTRYILNLIIPPASTKLKGGILVSPCPSVCLSVCGQNRVRSVSSTILIGSISYLHILSSNLRRCVACNAHFKIQKFKNYGEFFKFVTLTLSSFDLGSNMNQWYG